MTRVQVLLLAALVLGPLFSLLMRAVKRRLDGEAPRNLGSEAPSGPAFARRPPAPLTEAGAGPGDTPHGRATGMVVASPAAGGRTPARLGSHRDVRRGIVLMTILGPCRALESPGA
jgi:hypothetical protein